MRHLLVVDDDKIFRETLVKALKIQGYRAMGISDPDTLASTIAIHQPDVVLLDLTFEGGINGLDVCRKLRLWSSIPVVIISAQNDEQTKVLALGAGANEYLAKPFGINELVARLRVVGHRPTTDDPNIVRVGDLVINFKNLQVTVRDKFIKMTRNEFVLLKLLADAQGRLVSYEQLLAKIWPHEHAVERNKVRSLVMHVRKKLDEDLSNPQYILTEARIGYRLNVDNTEQSRA